MEFETRWKGTVVIILILELGIIYLFGLDKYLQELNIFTAIITLLLFFIIPPLLASVINILVDNAKRSEVIKDEYKI